MNASDAVTKVGRELPARPVSQRHTRRVLRQRPVSAPQLVAIAVAVTLWWWGSAAAPTNTVAAPWDTVIALGKEASTTGFWAALGVTLLVFGLALLSCIAVGVPLGLVVGRSRFVTSSSRLVFDFLRTIPPIALLPLVILEFGATGTMAYILAVLGGLWPILIQSVYAARQTEPQLEDMARAFKVNGRWHTCWIFIPSVVPFVMTGVRISATICLLLTIAGQLLGGAPGIGAEMYGAMNGLNTPMLFAYVFVSGILGVLVSVLLWQAQRYVLHWHPSFRSGVKQ